MDTLNVLLAPWLQTEVQPLLLKELALLGIALLLSWLISYQLSRFATQTSVLFGRGVIDGVLFPLAALALAYLLRTDCAGAGAGRAVQRRRCGEKIYATR